MPWHINIVNKHDNIHEGLYANHNAPENPPLLTQTRLLGRKEQDDIWDLGKLQHCS